MAVEDLIITSWESRNVEGFKRDIALVGKQASSTEDGLERLTNAGKRVGEGSKGVKLLDDSVKKLDKSLAHANDTSSKWKMDKNGRWRDEKGKFAGAGQGPGGGGGGPASLGSGSGMGGSLGGALTGGLALGGLNMVSNQLLTLGRNSVESQNLISESFGDSTTEIQSWGANLQSTLGLSSLAAQKNAATFNVMFGSMGIGTGKALEMSKGLTVLAEDMASFYNLDSEAAFEKLRAGITGETEPLKALGIMVSDATIKAYALKNGIGAVSGELTESEKVLARYGAIMEQTSKAQGDLARTLDSPANAARRLGVALTVTQTEMGKGAAEARAYVDNALIPLVTELNNGHQGMLRLIGSTVEYGTMASNILAPIWGLTEGFMALKNAQNLAKMAQIAETGAEAAKIPVAGAQSKALNLVGDSAVKTAGKVGILGKAQALLSSPVAKGAGVAVAGVAVGVAGYDAIREEGAPSAGEIASYYKNRALGNNADDSALLALGGDPSKRGNDAEKQAMAIYAKSRAGGGADKRAQTAVEAANSPTGYRQGQDVGSVSNNRNGSRTVTFVATLPESRGDASARKERYNSLTPAPLL